MKKVLKYLALLILILILAAIMHFEFGLFTRYNYFTAKYDLIQGNTDFASYGLSSFDNLFHPIYSKYGIRTTSLGCVINLDDSQGGVKYYNRVKDDYFKDKYGLDFFERFEKEVKRYDDSISKVSIEDRVINLISNLKIVKEKIKLVDSLSNHKRNLEIVIFVKDSIKNIYWVKVWEDNGFAYASHFNFFVDSKGMNILNPSGDIQEYDNKYVLSD